VQTIERKVDGFQWILEIATFIEAENASSLKPLQKFKELLEDNLSFFQFVGKIATSHLN